MKVTCAHCRLPFSVGRVTPGREVYCCSGCALAARLPLDAPGQFPVNGALIAALGVGFGFFNQVLLWLLAVLLARTEAGAVNAGRFVWASLAVGALVLAALTASQWRAGAHRVIDLAMPATAALLLGLSAVSLSPLCAILGNAVLATWSLRGLFRKRS